MVSRSRISPTRMTFGAWRRAARKANAKVSRAVLLELADRRLVLPHDVVGNRESVLRTETLQTLIFELHELAADFDLRGAAGRENQVADVRAGLQHGSDELRRMNRSLCGRRRGRRGCLWRHNRS